MTEFVQTYGIHHIKTTAYHPQANGLVERANQTIKGILSKLVTQHGGDWDLYINSALFAIRTSQQESTHMMPAMITYRRQLRHPADQGAETNQPEQDATLTRTIWEKAAEFIRKAQDRQKENYDKEHKDTDPLHIGDKVLLFRNVVESSWSRKLEPKWEGPYLVHSIKGTTYKLRKPTTLALLPFNVHRNRLKKYHVRNEPPNNPRL